jgi:hypothetical protein
MEIGMTFEGMFGSWVDWVRSNEHFRASLFDDAHLAVLWERYFTDPPHSMKQLSIWLCMSIAEVRQLHAGIKPHVEQVLLEAQAEADVVAKEKAIDRANESLFGLISRCFVRCMRWFGLN